MKLDFTSKSSIDEARAFTDQVQARQRKAGLWLAENPFVQAMHRGEATKQQVGEWCRQLFVAIEHLHRIAHSRPRLRLDGMPKKYKAHFWENRVEEQYGALSGTAGHLELLIQLGEACGVPRLDMVQSKPNTATRMVMDWASEHVPAEEEFLTAQVVIGFLEAMNPETSTLQAEACRQMGLTEEEIRFFTVHITADAEHGDVAIEFLTMVPQEQWPMIEEQVMEQSRLFHDMYASPLGAKAAPV